MCVRIMQSLVLLQVVFFAAGARPNILWIVADDLGWGDLGFRNGGQIKTPVLDNFAREGAVLTNYYVQASCTPSRATFMTGRYPRHHGLNSPITMFQSTGLALNETTVAQMFRSLGYATHAIGKWHIGALSYYHTPTFRGFQSFYGFYGGSEDYRTHSKGVQGRALDFRRDEGEHCGKGCSRPALEDVGSYSTRLFTSEAVRIIEDLHGRGEATPWFMYLAYQAVHFPSQVPHRYSNQYRDAFPEDPLRVKYAGLLSSLDEGVGRVLDAVNRTGQLEKTLVVFTTDNGGPVNRGASNSPLRGTKGELWEGGTRGTAMVRGPGVVPGTEYASLMHAADWLPTLLGAADSWPMNGTSSLPIDGINLWDSFRGVNGTAVREEVFYGSASQGTHRLGPALRVGDYKLLLRGPEVFWSPLKGPELYGPMFNVTSNETSHETNADTSEPLLDLYNLREDPGETKNIAAAKPERTQRMLRRLEAIWNDSPAQMDWQDSECAHPMNKESHALTNGTVFEVWAPMCDHLYTGIFAALGRLPGKPCPEPVELPTELPGLLVPNVSDVSTSADTPPKRHRLRNMAGKQLPWMVSVSVD